MAAIPNRVVLGDLDAPILTFYNSEIEGIVEETAVSPIGDELFIDQFYPTVRYGLIVKYYFVPADFSAYNRLVSSDGYTLVSRYNYDIRNIPYGTPIRFYSDNKLHGLFYVDKVERQGRELFKIDCVSAVGLMDKQRHHGGVYFGTEFDDLLEEITDGQFEYEIDPPVASLQVFGWLPYSTRRRNLHQLLVAYGVTITKSDAGKMLFTFLNPTTFEDIEASRIFNGGRVEYGEPASRVELTEHSYYYLNTVEYKDLFDTQSEAVEHITVTFDEPIYPDSLETEGEITIHQAGVNYAVISGVGILRGQPYIHNTKLLVKNNPDAVTEKIVTVDEATLITLANSENALERISNYYFHATKVTQDIVVDDEKTGRRYRFDNPFMEKNVGVLSRMSVNTSSFRRAECDFITGYTPLAQGSSFLHRQLLELTTAGVRWDVPQSVYEKDVPNIRLVLIGKGGDGAAGQNGEDGHEPSGDMTPGGGGAGGLGGAGGIGGKVLSVTVDCTNIAFITVRTDGVNTLVQVGTTLYTSANGFSSPSGYTDLFTGAVFALPGQAGIAGAAGGDGGYYPPIGGQGTNATNGGDLETDGTTFKGGKAGKHTVVDISSWATNDKLYCGGNGGGGAAVGASGGDAVPTHDNGFDDQGYGHGGDGADAAPATQSVALYGCGGSGGNGGGGGGGGEIVYWWNYVYTTLISTHYVEGGTGGSGSAGTSGYRGCVLIYY